MTGNKFLSDWSANSCSLSNSAGEFVWLLSFCSARLQAGTMIPITCPPEGGRYTDRMRVVARTHLRETLY
jgi:hypothetical protein